MIVIGFVLLGVGLGIGVLLAVADPVLLSRINGEQAEGGGSGRHINAPRIEVPGAEVVRLSRRTERHEPTAA